MYHDGAGCKKPLCDCEITGRLLRGEASVPWYGGRRFKNLLIMNVIIMSILFFANLFSETEPAENARAIGDRLFWAGKHEEALPHFNKILEKDPNNLYALSKKCDVLRFIKLYKEALSCYDGALTIHPDSFTLQDGRKETTKLLSKQK
jgi:tetratricopeptide (TPR) repeat protein